MPTLIQTDRHTLSHDWIEGQSDDHEQIDGTATMLTALKEVLPAFRHHVDRHSRVHEAGMQDSFTPSDIYLTKTVFRGVASLLKTPLPPCTS